MPTLEFLVDYFSSPFSLMIMGTANGLAAGLAGLSLLGALRGTYVRAVVLSVIFVIGLFTWAFIGVSLFIAGTFFTAAQCDNVETIKTITGSAILGGLAIAFPSAFVIRRHAMGMILNRLRGAVSPEGEVLHAFRALCDRMDICDTELLLVNNPSPSSLIVRRKKNIVVASDALLKLLDGEELSTVLAHELAHVKNADVTLKTLFSVYRFVVPFDPLIRLVEAAAHRQREFLADEVSASVTGKPVALASALIKIHEALTNAGIFRPTRDFLSFYSIQKCKRLFSRYPSLSERVNRLLKIANTTDSTTFPS